MCWCDVPRLGMALRLWCWLQERSSRTVSPSSKTVSIPKSSPGDWGRQFNSLWQKLERLLYMSKRKIRSEWRDGRRERETEGERERRKERERERVRVREWERRRREERGSENHSVCVCVFKCVHLAVSECQEYTCFFVWSSWFCYFSTHLLPFFLSFLPHSFIPHDAS